MTALTLAMATSVGEPVEVADPEGDAPAEIDVNRVRAGIAGTDLVVEVQWTEPGVRPVPGSESVVVVETEFATITAVHTQDQDTSRTASRCTGSCADVRVPVRAQTASQTLVFTFDFSDDPELLEPLPRLVTVTVDLAGETEAVDELPVEFIVVHEDSALGNPDVIRTVTGLPPGPIAEDDGAQIQFADERGDTPGTDLSGLDAGFLNDTLVWFALFAEEGLPPQDPFFYRAEVTARVQDTTVSMFSQVSERTSPRASAGFECAGPSCPATRLPGTTIQGPGRPFVFVLDLDGIVPATVVEVVEVAITVQESPDAATTTDALAGPFEVSQTPRHFEAPSQNGTSTSPGTTEPSNGTVTDGAAVATDEVATENGDSARPILVLLFLVFLLSLGLGGWFMYRNLTNGS